MSRSYNVRVDVKGISVDELVRKMAESCDLIDSYTYEDQTTEEEIAFYEGSTNLCGGTSEKEAHDDIEKELQKINPKAKVQTSWLYTEDLPYTDYGDIFEGEE